MESVPRYSTRWRDVEGKLYELWAASSSPTKDEGEEDDAIDALSGCDAFVVSGFGEGRFCIRFIKATFVRVA